MAHNRLEVEALQILVRSPKALPCFASPKENPYPDLFGDIYAIEEWLTLEKRGCKRYLVHCSQLSVFTVAGDLATMASLYEQEVNRGVEVAL